jgi:DNA polymerase-1
MRRPSQFRRVLFADTCLSSVPGEVPSPVALVIISADDGDRTVWNEAPSPGEWGTKVGCDDLVVCLIGEDVAKCVACWGLPQPRHLVDLGIEARMHWNGTTPNAVADLGLALARHGVARASLIHQVALDRKLLLGPLPSADLPEAIAQIEIRLACLAELWREISDVNLAHALLRGRYIKEVARMALRGWPVDARTLQAMEWNRQHLQATAVGEAPIAPDGNSFFYRDDEGFHFRERALAEIAVKDQHWPVDEHNIVELDNDALDLMEQTHPELRGLVETRRRLDGLAYGGLPIGSDRRHRHAQRPFASNTGRNQPLGREALPMQAKWRRHLIVPPPGRVLIVADYSSEELAIVAAMARDEALMAVYRAPDPYLWMAFLFGMAPADATKKSHARERGIFKVVSLAVQYGGGPGMIAGATGLSVEDAGGLLTRHRKMFPHFWAWSDAAVNDGLLNSRMETVFGWRRQVEAGTSLRTLQNFPAQANGGEILRLASIGIADSGLELCGTIHDAVAVEAAQADAKAVAEAVEHQMKLAGGVVLDGFELKAKPLIIQPGERWREPAGVGNWNWVVRQLGVLGISLPNP